jgi:quercetin dioxygenase-like cupin family protein
VGVAPTVYGGQEHTLRQTLIALASGQQLDEHESRGEATLHVLHGPVRLTTDNSYWDATAGDHLVTPPDRHGLEALEDGVVLLTVAIQGSSRHAARPEYWIMAHVMRPGTAAHGSRGPVPVRASSRRGSSG